MKIIRARKIYRHEIGNFTDEDELIFEEKSEAFTVSIGLSSDEKYYFIQLQIIIPQNNIILMLMKINQNQNLIIKRERGILYSSKFMGW